jgi:vancomycin resistance protein YoaR
MTTGTARGRLTRPFARVPSGRAILIGFACAVLLALAALAGTSAAVGITTGPAVLPNVSVGDVDLSGLDRAAAAEKLEAQLPSVSSGSAHVTAGGEERSITYAELGRRYDLDAMLDAALGVGREGGVLADGVERLRSLVQPTVLPVLVHQYDDDALASAAHRVAADVTTFPREATVTRDGRRLTIHPSSDGRRLDEAAVATALAAALDSIDPANVSVELAVTELLPVVDTDAAAAAADAARAMMTDLELTIPGATDDEEPLAIGADGIAEWVRFGVDGPSDYAAQLDTAAIAAWVETLGDEIDRGAVDAILTARAGGGVGGYVAGLDARELQRAEAVAAIEETIESRASGPEAATLQLPVVVTEPSLTTAEAAAALPEIQLVSSWTTYYVPNEGNGFGNNISIGAWDLDGYNIAPGEWFSFWGGIGPVTLERGYRPGGAIINGRSVRNGALAGGICSTSTTLFNAAMRFGLEIGERENHYYYIDRYPTGLDATVAIVNNDVTDMTFRNDTDQPIVIRAYATPGQVTFQMWSVPNGRTVVLGQPITSNHRTATDTTTLVPTMAPGSAQRVEFPHNGFDVSVTRTVYGPDGGVVHQNTWFSDYRAVNGITLVGPPLAAPDDGDEGDDEAG